MVEFELTDLLSDYNMITDVPGPPAAPEVSNVQSTSCRVRYQLPIDEGDGPVTGYQVQLQMDREQSEWVSVGEAPTANLDRIVEHLQPMSRYRFRVSAENRFGFGDYGPPSQFITTDNSVCNFFSNLKTT